MPSSYLIAVNCHPFHRLGDINATLDSLAPAVAAFRQCVFDKVEVHVFWNNRDNAPPQLRSKLAHLGFMLTHRPHVTNGENINRQIDYAAVNGFDILFRVDGDDTVFPQRFIVQARMLETGDYDICGGALLYKPHAETPFKVLPRLSPTPRDYLENSYVLHPSMAIRLAGVRAAGLRYWPHRLEDKAFLLHARRAGLAIGNVPEVLGSYHVDRNTRNTLAPKWLALQLNLSFLWQEKALYLIPYALALFVGQVGLGSHRLRRLRAALYRPRPKSAQTTRTTKQSQL